MARSDKAPFRREYELTSATTIPEEAYIGDIKTIYLSVAPMGAADGFIQGKVGSEGAWFDIPYSIDDNGISNPIDIKNVEYIRFEAISVRENCNLTIFGYYDDSGLKLEQQNELLDQQVNLSISINHNLKHLIEQLEKMNIQLQIITGEEVE